MPPLHLTGPGKQTLALTSGKRRGKGARGDGELRPPPLEKLRQIAVNCSKIAVFRNIPKWSLQGPEVSARMLFFPGVSAWLLLILGLWIVAVTSWWAPGEW